MKRPLIAITMGDPAGIGPEICLKLISQFPGELERSCVPVVFGDATVLQSCAQRIGLRLQPPQVISSRDWPHSYREISEPAILDLAAFGAGMIEPGVVSAATGLAGFRYIEAAIRSAVAGEIDAVTTGPIHKEALRAAGLSYPGHTEIFAELTGAKRACMMLTSPQLTCSFVTVHVGYSQVPELLNTQRISDVIQLTANAVERLRQRKPRIVVCGLNPHAGEHGLFGNREEERIIAPAIEMAKAKGIRVEGPLPPDTAFLESRRQRTDAFICMYHDQGHIPLKALAFDDAVNITLGLPIIRTSVDHGTACDIAWQGKANPKSLIEATLLAARLAAGDSA